MKKAKFQISMATVCFFLAFLITWQYRSVRKISRADDQVSKKNGTLQSDYKKEMEKNLNLQRQMAALEKEVEKYRNLNSGNSEFTTILKSELERMKIEAGAADVHGPGVIVTLSDKKDLLDVMSDQNSYIVHDTIILDMLNELRAAGAEALSLNDERVLATSEIRCAGPTISMNNTRYATPFEIKAIGNPATLENSLKMRGGIIERLDYCVDVDIKKNEDIKIGKFKGAIDFKYAKSEENTN